MLLCGSYPYRNLNISKLIDNNFTRIYRCNMNIHNSIYGNKVSEIQFINCHIWDNILNKKNLLNNYKSLCNENIILNFQNFLEKNKVNLKYLNNNYTDEAEKFLKRIKSNLVIKKQLRVGLGALMYFILNNNYINIIGFGLIDKTENSYYHKICNVSNCHDADLEKKIIFELHNKGYVNATLSCLEDKILPTLNCKYIKPKIQSLIYILKTYGICIIKNYYSQEILDIFIKEYHKLFQEQQSKIEILDKEECSNDERIFHSQKYSQYIKQYFSDDKLFNSIALEYTKHKLNKKTLINKVVHEEGKIKNSGAGWHRDNHDCQFKVLMYLSDVNEKNGPFQFITNSSKKYIGYPPPRHKKL